MELDTTCYKDIPKKDRNAFESKDAENVEVPTNCGMICVTKED